MQLIVESISQSRGGRRIISGLSFSVSGGEAVMLTGPNGAGKTTLIRTLVGFMAPLSGRVHLEGGDNEKTLTEQCHYLGHQNGLKANLTVRENLAFWAAYLDGGAGPDVPVRVAHGLAAFDIERLSDVPAGYLSAGQKRRAALARLLVTPRPLWLLDEPTSSLDTRSSTIVRDAIGAHIAGGGLAVVATHLDLGIGSARELRLGGAAEAA